MSNPYSPPPVTQQGSDMVPGKMDVPSSSIHRSDHTDASTHADSSPRDDHRVAFASHANEKAFAPSNATEKPPAAGSSPNTKTTGAKKTRKWLQLPAALRWIPANWTWAKWKPALRGAVAGWVSTVLFLIGPVQRQLGVVRSPFFFNLTERN
jgi:hypothetical protein